MPPESIPPGADPEGRLGWGSSAWEATFEGMQGWDALEPPPPNSATHLVSTCKVTFTADERVAWMLSAAAFHGPTPYLRHYLRYSRFHAQYAPLDSLALGLGLSN